MFTNLMRGELARLRYRRRAWGSLIIMTIAGLLVPVSWTGSLGPPDADIVALAARHAAEMRASGECPTCTVDDLLNWPTFDSLVSGNLSVASLGFAFLTFMIIVAYVGADFSSGAISTQLTFTPRRTLVLGTRTLACGVLGALLMAAALLPAAGLTLVAYILTNGVDSVGSAPELVRVLVGAVLYGALLGAIASLLTFLIPSTPLAMAAAVVVLVGNAMLLRVDQVQHLLPMGNAVALITDDGIVGGWQALLYHLAVGAVLFLLAAPIFERRDVKA